VQRISGTVRDFVGWAFERRKQLIQLVVLVGIALEMAETFLQKTGPEKKEYTKEVILAVSSE